MPAQQHSDYPRTGNPEPMPAAHHPRVDGAKDAGDSRRVRRSLQTAAERPDMTCSALMTKDPLTARESETVGAASEKLIAHHYINLPVVDGAGKFRGMFGIYD